MDTYLPQGFNFNDSYDYLYVNDYYYIEYDDTIIYLTVSHVIAWIVITIGFPLTILAIYALHLLVRDDHVAPVYVINLLISDLIQICCFVVWVAQQDLWIFDTSRYVYDIGVLASVGFMVCVALERYLVVACPLWYRFRRSIKLSVFVSIMVWALSLIQFLVALLTPYLCQLLFRLVFFLLPYPLLIFSLAGTLKALSGAISVSSKEKRRIVGTLVLVLLNYTVLFLPSVIQLLKMLWRRAFYYFDISLLFLQFSPLADLVLYVFMRKGVVDKLLACLCCCKMAKEEEHGQVTASTEKTTEDTV